MIHYYIAIIIVAISLIGNLTLIWVMNRLLIIVNHLMQNRGNSKIKLSTSVFKFKYKLKMIRSLINGFKHLWVLK